MIHILLCVINLTFLIRDLLHNSNDRNKNHLNLIKKDKLFKNVDMTTFVFYKLKGNL